MRESEKRVGRADNNPQGGQISASGNASFEDRSEDSADQRTHGAHGKGRDEEQLNDGKPIDPAVTKNDDSRGSASWGSEGSGGSVADRRSEK